jgi:hypothetical protein
MVWVKDFVATDLNKSLVLKSVTEKGRDVVQNCTVHLWTTPWCLFFNQLDITLIFKQEEADKKRRNDFKRYEMEKKFEHEQRLQHIEDEERRKEEERRMKELVRTSFIPNLFMLSRIYHYFIIV